MKKFWLNSLLRVYAMTMFVIVGFVALLISYASWQSKVQEVTETSQRISTRLVDEVESYYQRGVQITKSLVGNQAKLEGVYNYFTMSPSEYIYISQLRMLFQSLFMTASPATISGSFI